MDDEPSCDLYTQFLSIRFRLRAFESLERLPSVGGSPRLIVIDPSGADVGLLLRRLQPTPVVVATRDDNLDFVKFCLSKGASALCLKPLRPVEVLLTFERLLGVDLLPTGLGGQAVKGLTLKERRLLALFLVRQAPLSREDLFEGLWAGVTVNRKTLDVHLFNLRRKIHPLGFDIVCENHAYELRSRGQESSEQFSAS